MTFWREKTMVEPPPPKKKLSPVCIQHDTTDANLELTVYSYILKCCVYLLFLKKHLFSYRGNCLGCLNGCYTFDIQASIEEVRVCRALMLHMLKWRK